MRELKVLAFISLDGVMQAPVLAEEDRSRDFQGAGWAKPYWETVMPVVQREAMNEPYDLLLGRHTHDIFSGKALSDKSNANEAMREQRKYVVTHHAENVDWDNSIAISGDIADNINSLKKEARPFLQVHGSWALIQTLVKHDLIDEYRLWTFPVVLGNGKRLFETAPQRKLNLVKSNALEGGVVMSIYRPGTH